MKAIVLLADGCEELEAVSILDVLRRGGVDVRTRAVAESLHIHGPHGIDLAADAPFDPDEEDFDLVAFPGGMGCMRTLRADEAVLGFLRKAAAAGKIVGAVCASPAVLGAAGLLDGRRYCCYPGIETEIPGGTYVPGEAVVRDGNVVTGTGPATAVAFALELLAALAGPAVRDTIAKGLLFRG